MKVFYHSLHWLNIPWSRRQLLRILCRGCVAIGLSSVTKAFSQPHRQILQVETLRVFVDALLPEDSLSPSACTLNVHKLILDDAKYDSGLQQLIDDGCRWLEQDFGPLSKLEPNQLEQLLQAMNDASWNSGPKNFFYHIRDRAVLHYYADPSSWQGTVINRPPQPVGYPEVTESS